MAVSLARRQPISLSKEAPRSTEFYIGLGWRPQVVPGSPDFDLDVSVVCLGTDGQLLNDDHFVYYNHPATSSRSVVHSGDSRTGQGSGDDEAIKVNTSLLAAGQAERVMIMVSIDKAQERRQTFGQIRDAYIRVCADGVEICRFNLNTVASQEAAFVFGELYRDGYTGEWKFQGLALGHSGGWLGMLRDYGVQVA